LKVDYNDGFMLIDHEQENNNQVLSEINKLLFDKVKSESNDVFFINHVKFSVEGNQFRFGDWALDLETKQLSKVLASDGLNSIQNDQYFLQVRNDGKVALYKKEDKGKSKESKIIWSSDEPGQSHMQTFKLDKNFYSATLDKDLVCHFKIDAFDLAGALETINLTKNEALSLDLSDCNGKPNCTAYLNYKLSKSGDDHTKFNINFTDGKGIRDAAFACNMSYSLDKKSYMKVADIIDNKYHCSYEITAYNTHGKLLIVTPQKGEYENAKLDAGSCTEAKAECTAYFSYNIPGRTSYVYKQVDLSDGKTLIKDVGFGCYTKKS